MVKTETDNLVSKLTLYLTKKLIKEQTLSKRALTLKLSIPYRVLLRLYSGKQSEHDVAIIMSGIALYCLRERIPPDTLFHGFAPR